MSYLLIALMYTLPQAKHCEVVYKNNFTYVNIVIYKGCFGSTSTQHKTHYVGVSYNPKNIKRVKKEINKLLQMFRKYTKTNWTISKPIYRTCVLYKGKSNCIEVFQARVKK